MRGGLCVPSPVRWWSQRRLLQAQDCRPRSTRCFGLSAAPARVTTDTVTLPQAPFELELGGSLEQVHVKYHGWNLEDKSRPLIYICPSMSNSSVLVDVGPERGWWNHVVGYGSKHGVDLEEFRVLCAAPLGSPFGSTCPSSQTISHVEAFPQLTTRDQARAHLGLLELLGEDKVHAIVGGSMGAMQALQLAALAPRLWDRCVAIAGTGRTSPGTVAMRSVQRDVVRLDTSPGRIAGMQVARKFGMLGYRTRTEFDERFAWGPGEDGSFEIESWLDYHARKFTDTTAYDSECWMLLSKCMDLHSIPLPDEILHNAKQQSCDLGEKQIMILPYASDSLIPSSESVTLAADWGDKLQMQVYIEALPSKYGHDAFLVSHHSEANALRQRLSSFLAPNVNGVDAVRSKVQQLHM